MTIVDQTGASKIQILDAPVAAPGTCIVCGSPGGDGRKFIDIGMDIEFYGVVYFCTNEFVNMADLLGYISSEDVKAMQDKLETLEMERIDAVKKEKLVDEFVDSVYGIVSQYKSGSDLLTGGVTSNEDEQVNERTSLTATFDNPESDEFDIFEGPDDLSGPRSNESRPATGLEI